MFWLGLVIGGTVATLVMAVVSAGAIADRERLIHELRDWLKVYQQGGRP